MQSLKENLGRSFLQISTVEIKFLHLERKTDIILCSENLHQTLQKNINANVRLDEMLKGFKNIIGMEI